MPLTRVVIDSDLLTQFKQRALRAYPIEYGEVLWGYIEFETAYVTSIERAQTEADDSTIEIEADDEFGDTRGGQTLLGTIHSHPDDSYAPSETDIDAAMEEPAEIVFGICAINKVCSRRYVSFGFYLPSGTQIELAFSEPDTIKRRKRPASVTS